MIFKPELIHLIRTGKKTQTRRRVQGDKVCTYRAGRDYSLQPGRGRHGVGRIRVVSVQRELLLDIDDGAAQAEGFSNFGEFLDYWQNLHGLEYISDRELNRPVWAITFAFLGDMPNLLTPASRPHGSEHGYTDNPLHAIPDEPEAVPSHIVDALPLSIAARARYERERLQREADIRALPIEQQLAALRTDERSALIRDDLRVIERRVEKAWEKLDKAA